jgi:hypothetical protein
MIPVGSMQVCVGGKKREIKTGRNNKHFFQIRQTLEIKLKYNGFQI